MEDSALIDLYFTRSENAIAETELPVWDIDAPLLY